MNSGLNSGQIIELCGLAVLLFFVIVGLWRRRQNFAHNVRKLAASVFCGILVYLLSLMYPQTSAAAPFMGLLTAGLLFQMRPSRKRRMRADVKRRVIAKWTVKTGEKFDPRKHDVDHIVPFSKGGGETEDNLRVIEKNTNRSKGAKSPWWDLMGR